MVWFVNDSALPARERYHVPIARADDRALAYPVPIRRYRRLALIGPGRNSLHLVAVTAVPGQQAEIIDETTVRIHIDWAGYLAYPAYGLSWAGLPTEPTPSATATPGRRRAGRCVRPICGFETR